MSEFALWKADETQRIHDPERPTFYELLRFDDRIVEVHRVVARADGRAHYAARCEGFESHFYSDADESDAINSALADLDFVMSHGPMGVRT